MTKKKTTKNADRESMTTTLMTTTLMTTTMMIRLTDFVLLLDGGRGGRRHGGRKTNVITHQQPPATTTAGSNNNSSVATRLNDVRDASPRRDRRSAPCNSPTEGGSAATPHAAVAATAAAARRHHSLPLPASVAGLLHSCSKKSAKEGRRVVSCAPVGVNRHLSNDVLLALLSAPRAATPRSPVAAAKLFRKGACRIGPWIAARMRPCATETLDPTADDPSGRLSASSARRRCFPNGTNLQSPSRTYFALSRVLMSSSGMSLYSAAK